jgi:hypothetical protein
LKNKNSILNPQQLLGSQRRSQNSGLDEHPSWLLPAEINTKLELMQVLAEVDEDEHPDDGAVEILLKGASSSVNAAEVKVQPANQPYLV